MLSAFQLPGMCETETYICNTTLLSKVDSWCHRFIHMTSCKMVSVVKVELQSGDQDEVIYSLYIWG